jgi:5-methylcytosine-specific restriction endonuclease McrA
MTRKRRTQDRDRIRRTVLARDGGLCRLRLPGCTTYATTVDHLMPVSKGGDEYDVGNCVASCQSCNGRKGNRLLAPRPNIAPKWRTK